MWYVFIMLLCLMSLLIYTCHVLRACSAALWRQLSVVISFTLKWLVQQRKMNCRKLKIQSNLGVILETNMKTHRKTFGTSLLSMLDKIIQTKRYLMCLQNTVSRLYKLVFFPWMQMSIQNISEIIYSHKVKYCDQWLFLFSVSLSNTFQYSHSW